MRRVGFQAHDGRIFEVLTARGGVLVAIHSEPRAADALAILHFVRRRQRRHRRLDRAGLTQRLDAACGGGYCPAALHLPATEVLPITVQS